MSLAAPTAEQTRTLGSYQLLDPLGQGGMGVVYRARHLSTGAQVALKTVRLPEPGMMRSIRREIHALRRVRHPGVVQVLEEGVEDGLPWYAMELLEGESLRQRMTSWWREPLGPPRTPGAGRLLEGLSLVRRICAALAVLHGEGIVHCDLKPDNVLIRQDGQPVLMDFGLVSAFSGVKGRESLGAGGTVEGSFGHMAPEQARGELVDARVDLYALGCMLYELVAGRPVFPGEGWEVLRRHLQETPSLLSRWVDGVPAALEALVQRLLAKEPHARVGYASDVAAVLEQWGAEREGAPGPAPRAYLYRPEFVGRQGSLEALEHALDRVRGGRGAFTLVGAKSGAGKTRLAMELATEANRRGFRVIMGECVSVEATPGASARGAPLHPFRPLLQAIADHCRAEGPTVTEAVLGAQGSVLALYEPALAGLGPRDSAGDLGRMQLSSSEARQRVLESFTQVLAAFAAEQPLLLVLDDLQWADELSLGLLEHLRREGPERFPLLLLGTYRSEEEGALHALVRAPGITGLRLEQLDEQAVAMMVRGMLALAAPPPRAFVQFLTRQSEGNPFFVAEYLRTAVDEGLLGRNPAEGWYVVEGGATLDRLETLPLPGSLRELLDRWLSGLKPEARELLERAAVLGREFDGDLLVGGTGETPTHSGALEALEALRLRSVLEESGAGRLRFSHDKLREVTYAGIARERLRQLHARAARGIESRDAQGSDAPRFFGVLANHWEHAGEDARALNYLEKAGRHALQVGALAEAAAHFERALALESRRGGPRVEAHRRAAWAQLLGDARFSLGDLEQAREQLLRALGEADLALPRTNSAWVGALLAQGARQLTHLVRAPSVADVDPARREMLRTAAIAANRMCQYYYYTQNMVAMAASALLAVNLAEQAGRQGDVRRQYAQLAYMAGLVRVHPLARLYFRRARESGLASEDLPGMGMALWYEAAYEVTFARWSAAEQRAEESIQLLTRIGSYDELQVARTTRAHVDYFVGRFEASAARYAEIRESSRKWSHLQYETWGVVLLARSQVAMGRLDAALEHLQEGLALLARQTDRASTIVCHALLAMAHHHRGEREKALHQARQVLRLARGGQPTTFTEGRAYEGTAVVLLAEWERAKQESSAAAAAQAEAREAVTLLQRFARMFPLAHPSALRCTGLLHWLSGHAPRARTAWRRSMAAAHDGGMPYDEALACFELGRWETPGAREREVLLQRAAELFSLLGCVHHLRQVEALRQERHG
jgi:tetratricopeptide (TPR) repeat protein